MAFADWKLVAIGVLVAAVGWQIVRLVGRGEELAAERFARVAEINDRNRAALREPERVATLQLTHAAQQQEIVYAYDQTIPALQKRSDSDAGESRRVRNQLAAYAARDPEAAASDPAACQRVADRAAVLADMAADGLELLVGT